MKRIKCLIFLSILPNLYISKEYNKNDPVVLKPVYHFPNKYESESYNYWHENKPQPHQHGIEPGEGKLHQHFKKYEDNENFDMFITGKFIIIYF